MSPEVFLPAALGVVGAMLTAVLAYHRGQASAANQIADAAVSLIEPLQKRVNQLETSNAALRSEITALSDQLLAARGEIAQLRDVNENLKSALAQVQQQNTLLRADLRMEQTWRRELQQENKALQARLDELERRLQDATDSWPGVGGGGE